MADKTPPPPPSRGTCNAEPAKATAMGKAGTDALLEQARIDAGAKTARYLKPGQAITKEYMGDRLNLEVDASNVVIAVRCG